MSCATPSPASPGSAASRPARARPLSGSSPPSSARAPATSPTATPTGPSSRCRSRPASRRSARRPPARNSAPASRPGAAARRYTAVRDVRIHDTADPDVIVLEYRIEGTRLADGEQFTMGFVMVLTFSDGLIAHSRDYTDPIAVARLLGRLADRPPRRPPQPLIGPRPRSLPRRSRTIRGAIRRNRPTMVRNGHFCRE